MANEIPQDMPSDTATTGHVSTPSAPAEPPTFRAFLRADWQWVALAWVGGWVFGGIFLSMAFTLESITTIAGVAAGGIFLIIAPGSHATWQAWRGYRNSIGKGYRKSRALETPNAG